MPDDQRESSFMVAAEHQVAQLRKIGRRWVTGLAVTVMLLAGGLGFTSWVAWEQHLETGRLNALNVANCETGNTVRAADRNLWAYVVVLADKGASPAQKKSNAEFLAYVNRVFAPRDCSKLNVAGATDGSRAVNLP